MFVPFLYPENPAPDAWLRRTYVFFISQFDINCFYKGVFHEHIPSFAVSPALAVFSVSAFIPMPFSADFSFDTGHCLLPAFSSPKTLFKTSRRRPGISDRKKEPSRKTGVIRMRISSLTVPPNA